MTGSQHILEQVKVGGDIGAGALTVAAIMEWAPATAAIFTALYAIFRLYEGIDKHIHDKKMRKIERDNSA